MSAFEPPQHQRSYSYPNPSLPPFSNLSQQTPHTINLHTPPLKKSSIMPSLDGGAASLQSAGTTTLPLLQPMDFSRYTTLYNTPTATQLAHQISHDRFQSNGNRADETPPTHHATLPSTPTEPTCASAHPTSLVESYLFAPQPKQHFAQILTWPQHHLEESREFITPSKINQGFTPLTLGNDLPLEAFPRSHTYSQPQTQGVPDYMGNMMRFEPIDEEEAAREAHLLKTRKHVCVVCNKRFNRPSSLSTHMAVHTGAKHPYTRPEARSDISVSRNIFRTHVKTSDILVMEFITFP
ncbi:hypothetical protein BD324DRAFT_649437 [Kockovaella imperatae]|uniref:pH-response transcription factor pacC/RIM101 n=1 Tax=Kockovaella imperatae TaxID=4999 RepID=A0A1Y1UMT1_9TREE|nr:hypothetical protein BD324DRAFT_649437 [Kockovaella imperatae]ORX39361.1 hypothetical protein BD324DRAFT_649437 [Kockovaella imperatae]